MAEPQAYERAHSLRALAAGEVQRPFVISQFSQRSLGLYMAADVEWKYIFSAADKKEWLFHLAGDPHELTNRVADPTAAAALARLRNGLIEQLRDDGYAWAVKDADWLDYGITRLPEDRRAGVLFQDPSRLEKDIGSLGGYARVNRYKNRDWLRYTLPQAMHPETGRVTFPRYEPPS